MNKIIPVLLLIPAAFAKLILVLVGLIAVKFTSSTTGLFRLGPNRPDTYWERAIRNPVGGFDYLIPHPATFRTYGKLVEPGETEIRFQWRYRESGWLCSMRCVWKYSTSHYGECYIGWKLGSAPPRLDFALSLRPWSTVGN